MNTTHTTGHVNEGAHMQEITINIEIPEGYEYDGYRIPEYGDYYYDSEDKEVFPCKQVTYYKVITIKKIKLKGEAEILFSQRWVRKGESDREENIIRILNADDRKVCFTSLQENSHIGFLSRGDFMDTFRVVEESTMLQPGDSGIVDTVTGKVTLDEKDYKEYDLKPHTPKVGDVYKFDNTEFCGDLRVITAISPMGVVDFVDYDVCKSAKYRTSIEYVKDSLKFSHRANDGGEG